MRFVAASCYITLLQDLKSEKATKEELDNRELRVFSLTRRDALRNPEMEAVSKILKLKVDELGFVETRVDEWRVVDLLFIEARCQ